jgi:hypothetical protein
MIIFVRIEGKREGWREREDRGGHRWALWIGGGARGGGLVVEVDCLLESSVSLCSYPPSPPLHSYGSSHRPRHTLHRCLDHPPQTQHEYYLLLRYLHHAEEEEEEAGGY